MQNGVSQSLQVTRAAHMRDDVSRCMRFPIDFLNSAQVGRFWAKSLIADQIGIVLRRTVIRLCQVMINSQDGRVEHVWVLESFGGHRLEPVHEAGE
jgi:hypothetical protein